MDGSKLLSVVYDNGSKNFLTMEVHILTTQYTEMISVISFEFANFQLSE